MFPIVVHQEAKVQNVEREKDPIDQSGLAIADQVENY
jgi:hypothetical protein